MRIRKTSGWLRSTDPAACRRAAKLPPGMVAAGALAVLLLSGDRLSAQSFRHAGTQFNAKRSVTLPTDRSYTVVVTEFLHHGQINEDGTNVVVAAGSRGLVPSRVLQLGPGDFCRVALETVRGRTDYEVFYGGDPPKDPPPWTDRDGLLLQTRKFRQCNLNRLDSVREAFDASEPLGSDYVEGVFHAENPMLLAAEPFLSRYHGTIHIPATAVYGFWTASQDCSFLLIDGELVVSAPGRHGPLRQARPNDRGDVRLEAGPHEFEYYHAAATRNAMMAVAWQVDPGGGTPAPTRIPGSLFRTDSIGRVAAAPVELRTMRLVPDFRVRVTGDVPLPDNNVPLVGVEFRDNSPNALRRGAAVHWDFGDGQTSNEPSIDHVYLRPDIYTVTLTLKQGANSVDMTNRIEVDRPALTRRDSDRLHRLDDYLPVLKTYTPRSLDAASLRQLVLAYQAKARAIEAEAEDGDTADGTAADTTQYYAAAVAAGSVAFSEPTAARGAEPLYRLADLVAPMARDRLGDSESAAEIWQEAARRINVRALKARCAIQAADVALSDLLQLDTAKTFLDMATAALGDGARGADAAALWRVWGDYYAATGNAQAAREAYQRAEELLGSTRSYAEQAAWRGAHSRSAEEFLKSRQYDRAAEVLRRWQREFPGARLNGYQTLLLARYYVARGMYAAAIAQAEQLHVVNPESPYADRLLLLAAECEEKRGRIDRALATLHAVLVDYPGSRLVPEVKRNIARLEAPQPD